MCQIKHEMERNEERDNIAQFVAVRLGLLKECEIHSQIFFAEDMYSDIDDKKLQGVLEAGQIDIRKFENREDLKERIKNAVNDAPEFCNCCAKLEKE